MVEICDKVGSLSSLLFILAIDPLQQLLANAIELKLLHELGGRVARFKVSKYANVGVIFIKPDHRDIGNLAHMLQNFEEVTVVNQFFFKKNKCDTNQL